MPKFVEQVSPTPPAPQAAYTIPLGDDLDLDTVYAEIDASGSGDVRPTLIVADSSGRVIAKVRQPDTIPGGDTGSATWALRLAGKGPPPAPPPPPFVLPVAHAEITINPGPVAPGSDIHVTGWVPVFDPYGRVTSPGIVVPTTGEYILGGSLRAANTFGGPQPTGGNEIVQLVNTVNTYFSRDFTSVWVDPSRFYLSGEPPEAGTLVAPVQAQAGWVLTLRWVNQADAPMVIDRATLFLVGPIPQ